MYTTGPRPAGLSAAIANTGGFHATGTDYTQGGTWTNPANGAVQDGSNATSAPASGGYYTDQLKANQFGFNLPPNAVIKGILVEYYMTQTGGFNYSVALNKGVAKTSGTILGSWYQFGGSSDLWGGSWTAADINNNTAFASIYQGSAFNSSGLNVAVDGVRVTVYWDYPQLAYGTVQKQHLYQVFRQGQYLGLLPNVTSDFQTSQGINTAGISIQVTSAISADVSDLPLTTIDAEDGTPLQAEDGTNLTVERIPDIVGNYNSQALFRNGNQLIVWEVSDYYPNGKQVFSGDIEYWNSVSGGTQGDQVIVKAYSDGADLNNFPMTGGDTLDQSQTSQNATASAFTGSGKFAGFVSEGQTFTVGAGITNLEAISIFTQGGANITVSVYNSVAAANASNAALATVTQNIPYTGADTEYKFVFAPIINVTAGQQYFFSVTSDSPTGTSIYYQNTDVYSGGTRQEANYGGGSGGGAFAAATGDLQFKTWYGGNTTSFTYSAMDPTNMLIDAITRYNAKGGSIKIGSTDLTSLSLTYPFNVATVFEGIQKFLDLAPYNWYWYVDCGTDTLYFKQTATTPKWYFTKGKHISGLNLAASTENVKNLLLFTGGPTSGVNLYRQYSDQTSVQNNKQRLDRQTDNRVTLSATADALGNSYINSYKNEVYQTSVIILDATMDTSLFKLGDTVGFDGFGDFRDQLCLQIVQIDRTADQATLSLGELPPRTNQTIKDIQAQLTALNTLANPSTPS